MTEQQFLRQIKRLLHCKADKKREILRQLESDIASAKEGGKSWEEIRQEWGTPEQFVSEFNEDGRGIQKGKRILIGSVAVLVLFACVAAGVWFAHSHEKNGGQQLTKNDETQKIYAEEFNFDGKVYIFGGGHLAQELVPVLSHLGFWCMVMDDREEYTAPNLFPGVQETKTVDFTLLSDILEVKKEDYLVVVTRGHSCDADVERFALRTPASYIGVVGSKRKTQYVREKLLAEGFTNEELDRVHAPIGIDIASETPAEIAISIAAQLIQIRAEKAGIRRKNK